MQISILIKRDIDAVCREETSYVREYYCRHLRYHKFDLVLQVVVEN